MKKALYYVLFTLLLSCNQEKVPVMKDKDALLERLCGEYDNFQQCWQENTEEEIHRVDTQTPHKHLHTVIRTTEHPDFLYVKIYEGRDSSNVQRESAWKVDLQGQQFSIDAYPWNKDLLREDNLSRAEQVFTGSLTPEGYEINMGEELWKNTGDTLQIFKYEQKSDWEEAHTLLKCRYFSGWITYEFPNEPDSSYRMGDLRIHDQGGIVQLILGDGTKSDYSIELTQLVYGKQLSIMKLAVYKEAFEGIDYNSRSISYTWTNPDAKRIGINLRTVSSGWTFIEPGYVSSNNMNIKK